LTALRPGVLRANVRDGAATTRLELATSEGFMPALPGKVTILADAALAREEIDIEAARAELAAGTEEQKAAGSDADAFKRAQSKIDFAHAKLKVAGLS
jgi:F0F1-type ATP synthase epsilon subunit